MKIFQLFMLLTILVFDIMWFYFSGEIPSRVDALILVNIIVISCLMILNSLESIQEVSNGY
jgi:hypothetical protein